MRNNRSSKHKKFSVAAANFSAVAEKQAVNLRALTAIYNAAQYLARKVLH